MIRNVKDQLRLGNRSLSDAKNCLFEYQIRHQKRILNNVKPYIILDKKLGWRNAPDATHPIWRYSTNKFGNRRTSKADFSYEGNAMLSIAIAGNSYVHGDESPDEDTWVWQLQDAFQGQGIVHNLGVSAYATDQSYLRIKEFAKSTKIDVAVLALTTTDIYRNLNLCRAFIMNDKEVPLFKPRFSLDNGKLKRLDAVAYEVDCLLDALNDRTTLKFLRQNDYFFPSGKNQFIQILRRLHVPLNSEWRRFFDPAIEITSSISNSFVSFCRQNGITPIILILPVYWGAFKAGAEFDAITAKLEDTSVVVDTRSIFTASRLEQFKGLIHHKHNHFTQLSGCWISDFLYTELRDKCL